MAEKEYIDRELGEKTIDRFSGYLDDDMIFRIKYAIRKHIPSADVVPINHGHWQQVDDTKCKCSECEAIAMIAQYPPSADKNFCPNCGAKMGNDTIAEKPFSILNCPECGGEVDMGKMCIDGNKKIATAMFECKKCHKYANILTDYTNNPRTALCLEWNRSVVAEEAHKAVKSAAEEATRKGVPVDCAKCRFYNKQFEICRKKNERVLPFCFCYDGEEREYRVK